MRRKTAIRALSLLLALILLAGTLPSDAIASWDDYEQCYEYDCPMCGCTMNYYFNKGDYMDVTDYLLSNDYICVLCGGCHYCYDEFHCKDCGACQEHSTSFCGECILCDLCYEGADHCRKCLGHFDEGDTGPECEECTKQVCIKCHNDNNAWCKYCGACLVGKEEDGDICPSFDSVDGYYAHCLEHCLLCKGCVECFLEDHESSYCTNCEHCYDCIEEKGLHCINCNACLEVFEKCSKADEALCLDCCVESGAHCPSCGEHVEEWCPTGGEGSHCMENCGLDPCDQCGRCFDCASLGYCEECYLCTDCCLENSVSAGCICGLCVASSEFEDHICPNCENPACNTGEELCQYCGLCVDCCTDNSESAGCACGMCVENPDFEAKDHRCEQCWESFSCMEDFCGDCGLCLLCCADNSESAGCDCGEAVCIESNFWEDHYCAECGHCVILCDCDSDCTCEKCNVGEGFEHTHVWDSDGFCTLCGASRDGLPIISVQPREIIRGKTSDPNGDYYENQFTISLRARDDAECQWYVSKTAGGTGTKIEDYYDEYSGHYATYGADTNTLTTWIPADACCETYYYYCAVTNPENGKTVRSRSAKLEAAHDYQFHSISATQHARMCVGDGCGKEPEVNPPSDHQFGPWLFAKYATATETGRKAKTCAVCGRTESITIPKLDPNHVHKYEAACSEDNPAAGHFLVCDCGRKLGGIQAHSWTQWETKVFPTATKPGESRSTCTDCGYYETKELPPIRYHKHWSFDEEESEEYLHRYREDYNSFQHWFTCSEVGCNEKFDTEPHDFTYSVPSNWRAKPAPEAKQGRLWAECKTCAYTRTYDFDFKDILVMVSHGKSSRMHLTKGRETFTISPNLPEGYRFYRWEIKHGGEYLKIDDPTSATTTCSYDRIAMGYEFKGDEFIWLEAKYEPIETSVYLTNPSTKKRTKLEFNHSMYKDGSMHYDGYADLKDDPDRIAYYSDDNVLYLSNYDGDSINIISTLPTDFKVVLQGKSNTITTSGLYGILFNMDVGGDLEITSDTGGRLNINMKSDRGMRGISGNDSNTNGQGSSVTVSGDAKLDIRLKTEQPGQYTPKNMKFTSCGIYSNRDISILDQADVTVSVDADVTPTERRSYECNGLRARDNINIQGDIMIYMDICDSNRNGGAAYRARNIFFDAVTDAEMDIGNTAKLFSGTVYYDDSLACHTEDMETYKKHLISDSHRVTLSADTQAYSLHPLGKWRRDDAGRLIVAENDIVQFQLEIAPGYMPVKKRCLEVTDRDGAVLRYPKKTRGNTQTYEIEIKGNTELKGVNLQKVDPFLSNSGSISAKPEDKLHLTYQVKSAEYNFARATSTPANPPWIYVEKRSGSNWNVLEGASAPLAMNGSIDFVDPKAASVGSTDEYRFALPIDGQIYYSNTIQVQRVYDPPQKLATAVEIYTFPTTAMKTKNVQNGYPAAYDDGRSWLRLDGLNHILNMKKDGNGPYLYETSMLPLGGDYTVAAEFNTFTGTLVLYGDQFRDDRHSAGASVGAIRTASDSEGNLVLDIRGKLTVQNDTTEYYRSGGKSAIEPAAISNPTGGIRIISPSGKGTINTIKNYLYIMSVSEPDNTHAGGELVGFTSVGIDAAGEIRIMDRADISIYPECGARSTADTMIRFVGIRTGQDLLLEDSAAVEIITNDEYDQVRGILAENDGSVLILDSARAYMELRTDGDSSHTMDSSGIEAYDVGIYSDDEVYLFLEQNNPGQPRGIYSRTGGAELDVADGVVWIDVYSADRGSFCFGGKGEVSFQYVGYVDLGWMDIGGKKGGISENEVNGISAEDGVTAIIPQTSSGPNGAVFWTEHLYGLEPHTLSVNNDDGGIGRPPWFQLKIGSNTINYGRDWSFDAPAGTEVLLSLPEPLSGAPYERFAINAELPVTLETNDHATYKFKFTMPDCAVELVPLREGEEFYRTVTVHANNTNYAGEDAIVEQQVADGGTMLRPFAPGGTEGVPGWAFLGWYTEPSCRNKFDFAQPITKDIDLYGGWRRVRSQIPNAVTFVANGHGTAPEVQLVETGKTATVPDKPKESGWLFGGWYSDKACTEKFDFDTPIMGDIWLYAGWSKAQTIPFNCTVTFDAGEHGVSPPPQTVKSGEKLTKPADPTEEGFAFVGWYKDAERTSKFNFNTAVAGDMTLYGKWIEGEIIEVEPEPPFRFDDVQDESKFYFTPVYWAYEHEPQITNGIDATHFGPDRTCTRGQVVTFLWRAAGCPEPSGGTNPFVDVKEGAFYYKAVLWAVEKEITKGTSATAFSPDQGCTRGQVVTFLHRFAGTPAPGSTEHPFVDIQSSAFYYEAVLWAVEKNITNGTDATHFSPGATCTRGQIVTFLYRALK